MDTQDTKMKFVEGQDEYGRSVQKLYFTEKEFHTRTKYLTEDEALEAVQNDFTFEEGKSYCITYLTPLMWKAAQSFVYGPDTDLADHVYSSMTEFAFYGTQALEKEDLHIFGIVVREMTD